MASAMRRRAAAASCCGLGDHPIDIGDRALGAFLVELGQARLDATDLGAKIGDLGLEFQVALDRPVAALPLARAARGAGLALGAGAALTIVLQAIVLAFAVGGRALPGSSGGVTLVDVLLLTDIVIGGAAERAPVVVGLDDEEFALAATLLLALSGLALAGVDDALGQTARAVLRLAAALEVVVGTVGFGQGAGLAGVGVPWSRAFQR
jgi:hypothetical protein